MDTSQLRTIVLCAAASLLFIVSLAGTSWYTAHWDDTQVGCGLLEVRTCHVADPSQGREGSCSTHTYGVSSYDRGRFGLIESSGASVLFFGGGAGLLVALVGVASLLGLRTEVGSQEELRRVPFAIGGGALVLPFHAPRLGARFSVIGLVLVSAALFAAPDGLGLGPDLGLFALACVLGAGGCYTADPSALDSRLPSPAAAGEPQQSDAPVLDEVDVSSADQESVPLCRKCEGTTAWVEQQARFRCTKCNLWQPQPRPPEDPSDSGPPSQGGSSTGRDQ